MAVSTQAGEYRGPVIVSLSLHALIVVLLSLNLSLCQREVVLPPVPAHVKAVVIDRATMAPVAAPAPEPVVDVRPEPPQPEPKPVPKPLPKKPEAKPVSKPVPKKPEAKPMPKKPEPKVAEKPAPREKPKPVTPDFSAMLDQEESALAARDAAQKAASQQAQRDASARALQDQKTINEYKALIIAEIVKRWNRPPSARKGMVAELQIILIPGGEVLDVNLLKSSGDPAFDRSAENAVNLAHRLPVPADPALFNAEFRKLNIRFRPEDLKQ